MRSGVKQWSYLVDLVDRPSEFDTDNFQHFFLQFLFPKNPCISSYYSQCFCFIFRCVSVRWRRWSCRTTLTTTTTTFPSSTSTITTFWTVGSVTVPIATQRCYRVYTHSASSVYMTISPTRACLLHVQCVVNSPFCPWTGSVLCRPTFSLTVWWRL